MQSFSLPKSSLLAKPWEYKQVYARGRRLRGHHFSLICLPNQREENRLGISVHGVRSSVRRNRIKRIVREFYRHHQSFPDWGRRGSPGPPLDIVFAIRKGFTPDSPGAVERAVRELLARAPCERCPSVTGADTRVRPGYDKAVETKRTP